VAAVIFVDTSALYALADRKDPNHEIAAQRFTQLLAEGEDLLTHNYVLVETLSLVQRRLGATPAVRLAASSSHFVIEWVGEALHQAAVRRWAQTARRRLSLIDLTSFLVMRQRGVKTAFAFDEDFTREGFRLYGSD
jgi:predicted nucleic acid-binding protein